MPDIKELILPFIHIVAGICFVGLHIGIRLNSRFYIKENNKELDYAIWNLKRQLNLILFLVLILALSAWYIMGYNINNPIFSTLASAQWLLYAFVILNLLYIYYQFKICEKTKDNKIIVCNEKLALIIYYFIPLNILISFIGIFFALVMSVIV